MGLKKLVGWEYPVFGHVFSKLMGCVKLVGTGAGAGAPSIKKFFKTDGAEKLVGWEYPRLRTCFFKTDGMRKACKTGAPRLWTCFIQI